MLFGGILLVSAGTLVTVSVFLHDSSSKHRVSMLRDGETHAVGMRQDAVSEAIGMAVGDLLFLAELNELGRFLTSHEQTNREFLSRELAAFAFRREIYDQIRVLSPTGMELLRIDYREGKAEIAGLESLQFKGDRYYFLDLSRCAAGSVYASPFDLNVEQGEVERPLRPMLRLGLALGNESGIRGYLLLNLNGSVVLDAFARAQPDPEAVDLLVNEDGYWLRGPAPDTEWGFALPERSDKRFQALFPVEWEEISATESGQNQMGNGLFTYDTLIPFAEADAARCEVTGAEPARTTTGPLWRNISWVPVEVLGRTRNAGALQLAGWNLFGILVLGTGSWALARWLARRNELHRRTAHEKALLQSTLRKYMPQEIRDRLLNDPTRHAKLGGESQDVAVLFADIRGFTRFTENHAPEDVVAVLNRTMTELTAPLRVYGGILDKYIGDGFLAFFESPSGLADAARRAVASARVMQRVFKNLWGDVPPQALLELGLGIGISTGRVVVGNVGSEDAMDYTVVGDAVNVAARLQDMAETGDILVSQPAHELLEDEDDADVMWRTKLRGRREPMNVHRLALDPREA